MLCNSIRPCQKGDQRGRPNIMKSKNHYIINCKNISKVAFYLQKEERK